MAVKRMDMIKRYRYYIVKTKLPINVKIEDIVREIYDYQLPIHLGKYERYLYNKYMIDSNIDTLGLYDLLRHIFVYEEHVKLKKIKMVKNHLKLEFISEKGELL